MWLAAGCMQWMRLGICHRLSVAFRLLLPRRGSQTGCSVFGLQQKAENRASCRERVLRATQQYPHRASSFRLSTMDFLHRIRPLSYFALPPERIH